MTAAPLLDNGEVGISGNAAVVVLARHEDIAVVAIVRGPGVLDDPVVATSWLHAKQKRQKKKGGGRLRRTAT